MREAKTFTLLFILCFYLLITNLLWLKLDKVVEGEEAPHLVRSIQLYRTIYYSLTGNDEKLEELKSTPKQKPWNSPLFYSFVLPPYFVFGISSDVAVITTSFFHLLIAVFTYLVGARMTTKRIGLLAAFICSTYPIIFNMNRQFSPNPAFVFFVLITIYFLLKSEGFEHRGHSAFAGVTAGLALLLGYTNWSFIFAGYISQAVLIRGTANKRARFVNLLLSLGAAFLISSWWYLINLDSLLEANRFIRLQFGSLAGSPRIFSLHSILHYFACLIYGQIYLLNTLLAMAGFILFIIKNEKWRILAILWVLIPYIFFTLAYESKNTRYTMPYLPLLAICASYLVYQIRRKWLLRLALCGILIHGFLVHILSGFEIRGVPAEISFTTGSKICYKLPLYGTPVWGRIKPVFEDYKVQDVLRLINDDISRRKIAGERVKKRYKLMFAPESPHFRPLVAGYYVTLMDFPIQIWPLAVRQFDFYVSSFEFDYIVLRTANSMLAVIGNTRPQMERAEKALLGNPPFFSSYFRKLGDFTLFDNSNAVVLKKVGEIPWNQDDTTLEQLFREGLRVNPESPFLHFEYSRFLRKQGDIKGAKSECKLVEYWYKENQEATGYLFLNYKRMTEGMIGKCKSEFGSADFKGN